MKKKQAEYGRLVGSVAPYLAEVEREIGKTALSIDSAAWNEMFAYFTGRPGHMLRPALVFLSALASSGGKINNENTYGLSVFSASLEMTHLASLVHDDVIDLSDERRGQPAAQVVFGNNRAVLGGNLLYLLSFSRLEELQDDFFLKRMLQVSQAMCLGEIEQLYSGSKNMDLDDYMGVITKKTASLIELACEGGVRLAGGDAQAQQRFAGLGKVFGILYQLQDDLADGDVPSIGADSIKKELAGYIGRAEQMLEEVDSSPYKDSLNVFLRMVSL